MNYFRQKVAGLWVALLMFGLLSAQAQTLPKDVREKIIAATVIILTDDGLGSGTLISPQGFILTNYHVIGDPDTRVIAKKLQVGTIRFVDQPPEVKYLADVVVADPTLDLAIIRITRTSDGKAVGNLNLPAVAIGDSNQMTVGDPIYVFGFQGTGGYTLTFSRGVVGGFTGEDKESGGKQWMKHDAQTGPGNSGGGVYDQDGLLIGIHSAGVSGDHNSRTSFMRPVALAWGLIGPNVAGLVGRNTANTNQNSNTQNNQNSQNNSQNTSQNAANWPPAIAKGTKWQVVVKGGTWTGTWAMAFNDQDGDGDFVGTGTATNRKEEVVAYQRENIWRINIGANYPYARCRFDPQNNTGTIQGTLYEFKNKDADGVEIGTCTAVVRAATTANTTNTNNTTNTTNTGNAAAWPPNLAPGQKWSIAVKTSDIDDQGTVTLTNKEKNGDISGQTVFGDGFTMDAFFFIGDQTGAAIIDMTDPKGKDAYTFWYRCRLDKQPLGKIFKGTFQSLNMDKDGNISNLKDIGTCEMGLK